MSGNGAHRAVVAQGARSQVGVDVGRGHEYCRSGAGEVQNLDDGSSAMIWNCRQERSAAWGSGAAYGAEDGGLLNLRVVGGFCPLSDLNASVPIEVWVSLRRCSYDYGSSWTLWARNRLLCRHNRARRRGLLDGVGFRPLRHRGIGGGNQALRLRYFGWSHAGLSKVGVTVTPFPRAWGAQPFARRVPVP